MKYLIALLILVGSFAAYPSYQNYKFMHVYGKSVVRLIGEGGGGTGFQVQYKGRKYIMTNDHVCGLAISKQPYLIVDSPYAAIRASHIVYRSPVTDICLLEPLQDLPALELASQLLHRGDNIDILGHPKLKPLARSSGRVGKTDMVDVEVGTITTDKEAQDCTLPKNHTYSFLGLFRLCLIHVRAQYTTAIIYPGNSGSPVLNANGQVVGVAFANGRDNKGLIIPLPDVRGALDDAPKHLYMY